MKAILLFFLCSPVWLLAQNQRSPLIGSLSAKKAELLAARTDSSRVRLLIDLCLLEVQTRTDRSMAYAQQAYDLARKTNDQSGMEWALIYLGLGMRYLANYPKSMDCELKALQIAERTNDQKGMEYSHSFLGATAQDQGYFETALIELNRSEKIGVQLGEQFITTGDLGEMALVYAEVGKLDSALYCQKRADSMNKRYNFDFPHVPYGLAYIYECRGDYLNAIAWYRQSGQLATKHYFLRDILRSYTAIGRVHMRLGNVDSAIYYAETVVEDTINHSIPVALEAASILNDAYARKGKKDSMVKYLRFTAGLKDSLFGQEQARQTQNLSYNESTRQLLLSETRSKMEELKRKNTLKLWFGGLVAALVFIVLFVFHRYRIAQLLRLQAMRNSISRDLHDDIGSDLTSIAMLSEIAGKKLADGQQETSLSAIRKINDYSYKLAENMNDIVWAVNPENDTIRTLLLRIKKTFSDTCDGEGISLVIEADEAVMKRKLSLNAGRNLYLVCKEAVTNAVKHARCRVITLSLGICGRKTKVTITDDGRGFDPDKTSKGNGLKNMRSRVEDLHGIFSIESSSNHTKVIIYL